MKQLLLSLFTLIHFCSYAQWQFVYSPELAVSRTGVPDSGELSFKSNKPISIRTIEGNEFPLYHYTMLGDSAIITAVDTIALKDIISVKGTVRGNFLRKVGGNVLALGGSAYGSLAVAVGLGTFMTGASLPFILIALPAFGVAYVGKRIAGPRRFDTSDKWTLHVASTIM